MDRRDFLKSSALGFGGLSVFGVSGLLAGCASGPAKVSAKTGMVYRKLGRSGIDVSAISIGCEGFSKKSAEQVRSEFDYAIGKGVNFIDIYSSNPDLRSVLGEALKGRRNKFVIQGHIGSAWEDGQYLRTRDLEKVKPAFQDLLDRLQTNYIDVGMIHYVDDKEDFDTVFGGPFIEYVKELRKKRTIRCIGLSTHNAEIATMAVKTGLVDVIMFSLNPGYDLVIEDGVVKGLAPERESLYELCEKEGVAIDVMKCFGGGNLLDAESSPFGRAFTPVQCLEYALTRPGVACVMCGVKTLEQLDSDLAWCGAAKAEKDFIGVLEGITASDWKGRCMYCTHCAPCSAGIDIASVNKYLALATAQPEVPETVRDHYNLLDHHASECTECGKCETRCPFDVKIMLKMKRAASVFGI